MDTRPFISIVIPAFNEEWYIGNTLESLVNQLDCTGKTMDYSVYAIIVVDSKSCDSTCRVVRRFIETHPQLNVMLLEEQVRGVVHARITGFQYALDAGSTHRTHYLVSADADTLYPSHWISSFLGRFKEGVSVCASAGYYPPDLWMAAPRLTEKYLSNVGTIFFHPVSIQEMGLKGRKVLFSEQIFQDFPKPMADCGFAITAEAYRAAGGYRIEYIRDTEGTNLLGEGWRLKFQIDRLKRTTIYMDEAPFITSPRRLIKDAKGLFDGSTYKGMSNFRLPADEPHYAVLDSLADKLDFSLLQRYVVKNYIVLQCLTRPEFVWKNRHYFDGFVQDFYNDSTTLNLDLLWEDSNDIFLKSERLTATYIGKILRAVKSLGLTA